jgi:hypothetical protein
MILSLAGTQPAPRMVVDDQHVGDIMQRLVRRHKVTEGDYDKIYKQFLGGSITDICKRLWLFCRKQLNYVIEDEKIQYLSCPYTILTNGDVDCKNYSLFCGGVLDAMKRAGMKLTWCYRFSSYDFWNIEPGHVFIVVNENTDNIFLDPVLDTFNAHHWYWHKMDRKIKHNQAIGRMRTMGATANSYIHSAGSNVYANDASIRPNGLTADQMGLPYAMQILARGFDGKHPGAADAWWNDPPVTFWYNGQQLALPPPNSYGQPAPILPVGLEIRYAPSFMGYTIPSGMPRPCVAPGPPGGQNYLRLCPNGFPEQKLSFVTIDPTSTLFSANDSFLLSVIEAAVGPLINAYSSYPYASNYNSTNNIDDKMFNHRNAFDLLQPSISKTVLMSVAQDVLPVVAIAANFIPGIGTEIAKLATAGEKIINAQPTAAAPTVVNPYSPYNVTAQIIPGVNNSTLGMAAAGLLLFFILNKN